MIESVHERSDASAQRNDPPQSPADPFEQWIMAQIEVENNIPNSSDPA